MIDGLGLVGGGVGDADGDAGEGRTDGAKAFGGNGGHLGVRARFEREVDGGDGGGFGEAVSFHGEDPEFVFEGFCEAVGEFFGTGDDELEGSELFGLDAAHVSAKKGGGGEEEVDLVFLDEFGEAFGFEGGGISDEVEAFDDGIPEGNGVSEGVE